MYVCRSFSLTRKGDLVNDGDEMVVLPTSPTSAVPGGDTCVTSSCLERRVSTLSYAPTTTPGQRSRTCSVMSTGDVHCRLVLTQARSNHTAASSTRRPPATSTKNHQGRRPLFQAQSNHTGVSSTRRPPATLTKNHQGRRP